MHNKRDCANCELLDSLSSVYYSYEVRTSRIYC